MDLSEIDLYFTSLDATASPFGDFSPAETLGKSGLVVDLHRLDLGKNDPVKTGTKYQVLEGVGRPQK